MRGLRTMSRSPFRLLEGHIRAWLVELAFDPEASTKLVLTNTSEDSNGCASFILGDRE